MMLGTKRKEKERKYSKLAYAIKEYIEEYILDKYDVTLEEEYRAGNGMRYDFCFPYLRELVAIEADGIQHTKYIPFFHGDEQGFENSKSRDFHKNVNTLMKNGHIIRVLDTKENFANVRKILDEELSEVIYLFEEGDVKCKKKR